ncbi:hypothetical protein ACFX11_039139 [Malus domestica]
MSQDSLIADDAAGSTDEGDWSGGEIEAQDSPRTKEDQELKDKLLRKYSGYRSTRKHEFSKSPRRRRKETSQKKQGKFSLIGGTFTINGLTQRKPIKLVLPKRLDWIETNK